MLHIQDFRERCFAVALCGLLIAPLSAQHEPSIPEARPGRSVPLLFDGKSLVGWTAIGGRYDGQARWTVEDGILVGRQGSKREGGLLHTVQRYRNLCVSLEVKLDQPFDSGLFVRMLPPPAGRGLQLTLDDRPGGQIGAIYADGFLHENKQRPASWRDGEWNRVTLAVIGDGWVEAWINGELVLSRGFTLPAERYTATGRFSVQVHGGPATALESAARFRDLRLVPLPVVDPLLFRAAPGGTLRLSERARKAGWVRRPPAKAASGNKTPELLGGENRLHLAVSRPLRMGGSQVLGHFETSEGRRIASLRHELVGRGAPETLRLVPAEEALSVGGRQSFPLSEPGFYGLGDASGHSTLAEVGVWRERSGTWRFPFRVSLEAAAEEAAEPEDRKSSVFVLALGREELRSTLPWPAESGLRFVPQASVVTELHLRR